MSLTNPGMWQEDLLESRRRTVLHAAVKRQVKKPVLVYDADLVAPEIEAGDSAEDEVAIEQPSGTVAAVVVLLVALMVAVAGCAALWYAIAQVLATFR